MYLQNLTKQKITDSCGLDIIIKELDLTAKQADKYDQFYINNLIIYLRALFVIKINLSQEYIDNMDTVIKTTQILKKHLNHRFSKPVSILVDVLEYNINYMSNVNRLRVV